MPVAYLVIKRARMAGRSSVRARLRLIDMQTLLDGILRTRARYFEKAGACEGYSARRRGAGLVAAGEGDHCGGRTCSCEKQSMPPLHHASSCVSAPGPPAPAGHSGARTAQPSAAVHASGRGDDASAAVGSTAVAGHGRRQA